MPYTKYHPVFLDLNGRSVLIVGGGAVAVEKLNSLLPSGARITVVSPFVREEIRQWHAEGLLTWERRQFRESDVEPAFMVIAATDEPYLNERIYECGNRRLKLTNSVDDPEHCNFIMSAIAAQGPLQVAVSSAGCSPAIAQRLRSQIRELLTEEMGELTEFLGEWRPSVKRTFPHYKERQAFWEWVIDSHIPEVLSTRGRSAAHEAMEEALYGAVEMLEAA